MGKFIVLDSQSLINPTRKIGRILVELDIHCDLLEVLDIEWRGHQFL